MAKAGDWPGKLTMQARKVDFTRRLAILMPAKALGRRSVHKAGCNRENDLSRSVEKAAA